MRASNETCGEGARFFWSPSVDAIRGVLTAPRRSAATALVVAAMAGPAVTEPVFAAGPPGRNELRIGKTAPYTGPASAHGVIAKVLAAYLCKTHTQGGS